jgi:hypothetical protein
MFHCRNGFISFWISITMSLFKYQQMTAHATKTQDWMRQRNWLNHRHFYWPHSLYYKLIYFTTAAGSHALSLAYIMHWIFTNLSYYYQYIFLYIMYRKYADKSVCICFYMHIFYTTYTYIYIYIYIHTYGCKPNFVRVVQTTKWLGRPKLHTVPFSYNLPLRI